MRTAGRSKSDPLSADAGQDRYMAERRQGARLVEDGFESAWGWSGPAGQIRARRRAEFLIGAARLGPDVRCLEVGCGTGEFTVRLLESGCDLTAVELSDATAEVCRARVKGRAEVITGNVETGEGIAGRVFDAVVGISVLHHLNLGLFLENTVLPGLRRGGRFAFTEPNMANPQVWAERHVGVVGRRRHTTPHETAFRAAELRSVLEQSGLAVETCKPFEFLHPSTPRRLIGVVQRLERRLEDTRLRAIAGSVRVAGSRS